MFGCRPALLVAALLAFPHSWSAMAGDAAVAPSRAAAPIVLAQYGGPQDFGGPEDGYGPPPGMDGPPSGYRGGPDYEPGYAPHRHGTRPRSSSQQSVNYHGFHIDLSEGGSSRNLTGQIASMEHQIDIVGSVGLSMSDLQLFRSLPIQISSNQHGGGHYDGGPTVQMGILKASDRRPVLLHEFMHVYHHSKLPDGFRNPEIKGFYEEAVSRNVWPSGSYMLKNPAEFFAMTASCYLYGTVARPPFTRQAIRTAQPDYYAYLERLFGPPHGTHSAGPAQVSRRGRATAGQGYASDPQGAYN